MKSVLRKGFTIIELIIVIVIIAILATITAVLYINAQQQARDLQVRDSADKVADALRLFVTQKGHFPAGGTGSTSLAYDANGECTTGSGEGAVVTGDASCTIGDTLIKTGYLEEGFFNKLPANEEYDPSVANNLSILVKKVDATHMLVYFWVGSPETQDSAHLSQQMSLCGVGGTPAEVSTYKMKNAHCVVDNV